MSVPGDLSVQDERVHENSTNCRRLSQTSASTPGSRHARELDSYIVALCSMALMIVLMVGTAGYAAARATFRDAPQISIQTQTAVQSCAADLSTFGTPAALALGLLGLIILSVATTPSRSKIVSRLRTREQEPPLSDLASERQFRRTTKASPLV